MQLNGLNITRLRGRGAAHRHSATRTRVTVDKRFEGLTIPEIDEVNSHEDDANFCGLTGTVMERPVVAGANKYVIPLFSPVSLHFIFISLAPN